MHLQQLEIAQRIRGAADDDGAVVEQLSICRAERDAGALLDAAECHEPAAHGAEAARLLNREQPPLDEVRLVWREPLGSLGLVSRNFRGASLRLLRGCGGRKTDQQDEEQYTGKGR